MTLSNVLLGGPDDDSPVGALGLAVLRATAGVALACAHGFGKLPPNDGFVGMVEGMGFPAPVVFAWLGGLAEAVGGLLLAVGLLTRIAALAIGINMAVAVFVAHAADPFQTKELAVLYGVVAIGFLLHGPGRWSLDAAIHRRVHRAAAG